MESGFFVGGDHGGHLLNSLNASPEELASALLIELGHKAAPVVEGLAGGANNRVFRVLVNGGSWVMKQYFPQSDDQRDRFRAEQSFYAALKESGVSFVPETFVWDPVRRLCLMECVEGIAVASDEITAIEMSQVQRFLSECQSSVSIERKSRLPDASEACFSGEAQLNLIEERLLRLKGIEKGDEVSIAAGDFVERELSVFWKKVCASVKDRMGRRFDSILEGKERAMSPSDFGFHNALKRADGNLVFFDFEYAGMDDPAKMICDVFCQPRVPVPRRFLPKLIEALSDACGWGHFLEDRVAALMPVFQFKWCCIMLNEFLKTGADRRAFAGKAGGDPDFRARQLALSQAALAKIAV